MIAFFQNVQNDVRTKFYFVSFGILTPNHLIRNGKHFLAIQFCRAVDSLQNVLFHRLFYWIEDK